MPKNEGSTSDVGGEMLVNRTYRVTGIISITVQQGENYYSASLPANLGVVFAAENYFTLKNILTANGNTGAVAYDIL